MFNQEDLDALTNATGISEMEVIADETIGDEYILRQRMYHAMGEQGSLPRAMLVDMLRHLNYQPPARKAPPKPMEIRWEDVRIGARVIYLPEENKPERKFYGTFKGKTEPGFIAVALDGAVGGWVDEFPIRMVALAPAGTPAFVKPTELTVDSLVEPAVVEQPVVEEVAEEDTWENSQVQSDEPLDGVELPGEIVRGKVDRSDPEGRVHVPVMEKDWSIVDPGTRVVYEVDGDLVDAEFIEDGPADGHVSIFVDGHLCVVPESLVDC
jgi:hypothetical protein